MMQANPCLQKTLQLDWHGIGVAIATSCSQYLNTTYLFAIKLFFSLKFLATINIYSLIISTSLIAYRCCCGLHMPSESANG